MFLSIIEKNENLPTCPLNHMGFMLSGGLMFKICGFFATFKYGMHAWELQKTTLGFKQLIGLI